MFARKAAFIAPFCLLTPAIAQHSETFLNVQVDAEPDERTTTAPEFVGRSFSWSALATSNDPLTQLDEIRMTITHPTAGDDTIFFSRREIPWTGSRALSGWAVIFEDEPAAGEWTFAFDDTFDDPGVDATLSEVNILIDDSVLPSFAVNQSVGSTVDYPLAPGEINWITINHSGGPLDITTAGSTNTGGEFGDNDTELALFAADGALIATNDDENLAGGVLTSRVFVADLKPGTYAIAATAFSADFFNGFAATEHTATGTNRVTITPAPGTAAIFLFSACAASRRKR